jgi:Ca2+-binding EF-hand superfamily protein
MADYDDGPSMDLNKTQMPTDAQMDGTNSVRVMQSTAEFDPLGATVSGELPSDSTFSKKELRYFRKMFNMFDTDHSGAIGFFEMKNLTKHLGVEMTDEALRTSMERIDENGNGDLEFEEFVRWLAEAGTQGDEFAVLKSKIRAQGTRPLSNAQIEKLHEVFKHFDTDDSGSIDVTELGNVFQAMGQAMTTDELEALMKQADDDGSGEMEFEEFLLLMCSNFGVQHAFDQDLLEAFHRFDPLKTGVVSCADLSMMIRELVGVNLTTDEVDEVIDVAHSRGDGYIEYMKWEALWDACRGISF